MKKRDEDKDLRDSPKPTSTLINHLSIFIHGIVGDPRTVKRDTRE